MSFTRQWLRNGLPITGATGSQYQLIQADVGQVISARVTATNPAGSTSANTSNSGVVSQSISNLTAPVIQGNNYVGQTLTIQTPATWQGFPPPTLEYMWLRDGNAISGADQSSYELQVADINADISLAITGSNVLGFDIATSNEIENIGQLPFNTVMPSISGTPEVGQLLTLSPGSWGGSPSPTLTYRWRRNGINISGATNITYTIQAGDLGTEIDCRVTAVNIHGTTAENSNVLGIVSIPINDTLPTIIGTPMFGETLTGSIGTWTAFPAPTYTRVWLRNGQEIPFSDTNFLTLTENEVGLEIIFAVTASNTEGSTVAESNPTSLVGRLPTNTVLPSISGFTIVGETLTADEGTWVGFPTPTFQYQWLRNGNVIVGANGSTYLLDSDDVITNISVVITGSNTHGNGFATSLPVGPISQSVENVVSPSISGTPLVGETLTANNGTWVGFPPPTFEYVWLADGQEIPGEDTSTLLLTTSLTGSIITLGVTGSNNFSSDTGLSDGTQPISQSVSNTVQPVITGITASGETLTIDPGTWIGFPPPSFQYQWTRNAVAIFGETDSTFLLDDGDEGDFIGCVVTASNTVNTAYEAADDVGPIVIIDEDLPVNTVLPSISGTVKHGNTLTATPGTWTNADTVTGQWYTADGIITGETGLTYTVDRAKGPSGSIGPQIFYRETATNTNGSDTADSNNLVWTTATAGTLFADFNPAFNVMSGSVSASNGGGVTSWSDTVNGYALTALNIPTWFATGSTPKGIPEVSLGNNIRFNAATDWSHKSQPTSYFFIGHYNNALSDNPTAFGATSHTSQRNIWQFNSTNNRASMNAGNSIVLNNVVPGTGVNFIGTGIFNGTSTILRVPTQTNSTTTGDAGTLPMSSGTGRFELGATNNNTGQWRGRYSRLIIYNGALAATDYQDVEKYLSWISGLSLA